MFATIYFAILIFFQDFSTKKPIKNAAKGHTIKKPPVGPARTAIPPLPPDKIGTPNRTITTTNSILKKPNLLPKKLPASITPIVCKVIGTGIKGKGIGGIKPKTATIAANIAA